MAQYPTRMPDFDEADEQARILQLLRAAGYGDQPEAMPQMQPSPGLRLGPLRVGGGTLDNISASILQSGAPPRGRNVGENLAGGFLQGFARARAGGAQARQAQFEGQSKAVGERNEKRQALRERLLLEQEQSRLIAGRQRQPSDAAAGHGFIVLDTPEKVAAIEAQYPHMKGKIPPDGVVSRAELFRDPSTDKIKTREDERREASESDAEALLNGVIAGDLSPIPTDLFANRDPHVKTAFNKLAAERGVNIYRMQMTHRGYQQYYSTLNGRLQLAVRQSIKNAEEGLDVLSDLNRKLGSTIPRDSRYPVLNAAAIAAAKQGVFGKVPRDLALQMDQQIGNLTSELANVYQGGGVPTEEARHQASQNFKGKTAGERSLEENIKLAKMDVGIRRNAILTTGPMTPATPFGGSPSGPPQMQGGPLPGEPGFVQPEPEKKSAFDRAREKLRGTKVVGRNP